MASIKEMIDSIASGSKDLFTKQDPSQEPQWKKDKREELSRKFSEKAIEMGQSMAGMTSLPGSMEKAAAEKILKSVPNVEAQTALREGNKEGYKQYLQALESVYGNVKQRMSDLGFGPETYYHGSPSSHITQFDPSLTGKNAGSEMEGIFFTKDKNYAKKYTSESFFGSKLSNEEKLQNLIDSLPDDKANNFLEKINKIEDYYSSQAKARGISKPNLDSNLTNTFNYNYIDDIKSLIAKEGYSINDPGKIYEVKLNLGKTYPKTLNADAQTIDVNLERYNSAKLKSKFGPEVTVFEPNQIRATQAAFDPRFKDSGNIMAGMALGLPITEALRNKLTETQAPKQNESY